jgi:transposase
MTMTTTDVLERAQNGSVNGHDDAVDPAAKPTRRRFSNDFKDRVVDEYGNAADSETRGALLRREGLYTSHISEWRNQRARRNQPATSS